MKVAAKIAVVLPVVLAVVGYASFGRAQDKKEAAPAAAPGGANAASSSAAAKSAADLPPANPKDVESLDAIVTAVYDVISGPPGPRDWKPVQLPVCGGCAADCGADAEGWWEAFVGGHDAKRLRGTGRQAFPRARIL
jgi:hypothetical protein